MRLNSILLLLLLITISGCQKEDNSPEFIEKAKGRYLFNSDEVIEVFFKDNDLFMKWRGANQIHPLKIDDTTFFVKEMNEKIQFVTNPSDKQDYIILLPKDKNTPIAYFIKKLNGNEKVPSEYLLNNDFDKALSAYLLIKEKDSLDPVIQEKHFNSIGYKELRNNNFINAISYFKVNIALYPKSPNVYDSLGDAFRKKGDSVQAINNYKKSLELDSSNSRIKRKLNRLENADKE
ncbi:MAG: hypothetical protein J7K34_06015 [Flavobacteriaceae bacterium]|nr:hypothetical protein [Flavobacteriaceae bacterium]